MQSAHQHRKKTQVGNRIFGWAADEGGCRYYRISLPLNALQVNGYDTHHHTVMPRAYNAWDVMVGQRISNPGPSERWQHLARQGRHKLVYELDDDLFNVDASSTIAYRFFSQLAVQDRMRQNIVAADCVTVSTEPLAERIRVYNPNVEVCPNYVPAWLLDHTPPQRQDGIITIGWGGSPTHSMDFAEVGPQLRRFLERNPQAEFHAVGTDYASWMRLPKDRCRFTPWIPGVETFFRTLDFHIAIAPLRPHVFNQSKSDVKVKEAAALGIPIVASDVGPYRTSVQHGVTGFLVKRDHEWAKYLRMLVEDEAMRKEMGAAGREWARSQTMEGNISVWEKVLCA
ncbi:glycosyltransferase [Streptomyces griseoaurantiacus]|uniref:D-inositol 3-phosphate glycosyltransferase n=1 Tax=Streptomyces griseoaurantiacus TaxID=68213 RepID=A0A7W2DSI5_9ACTN|nr:glycosyltransferase [Streptomyces griseoaurantiacus]MBA5222209.1 glycosyltransferase [Streptomyces griseoaurantiacus]